METVQKEGPRIIKRMISYYNLDLVLSIGYRVNSKKATHFRQWATRILKEHIQEGYTIKGIIGNIMQSFAGKALYPSIEEKAAHLLYFIIKNHPFVDGNKRSGAYAFIWLLRQAEILDLTRITPQTLTALTILIAESKPQDKEKMIGLVCTLLAKKKHKQL